MFSKIVCNELRINVSSVLQIISLKEPYLHLCRDRFDSSPLTLWALSSGKDDTNRLIFKGTIVCDTCDEVCRLLLTFVVIPRWLKV